MITEFKIYEDNEDYYWLDLKTLWLSYLNNFELLYPDVKIRTKKKDFKTIVEYYKGDLFLILKGKETIIQGENVTITDLWTRYTKNFFKPELIIWVYKVKVNDMWKDLGPSSSIKIYNSEKSKLEKSLELLSSTKKYNL